MYSHIDNSPNGGSHSAVEQRRDNFMLIKWTMSNTRTRTRLAVSLFFEQTKVDTFQLQPVIEQHSIQGSMKAQSILYGEEFSVCLQQLKQLHICHMSLYSIGIYVVWSLGENRPKIGIWNFSKIGLVTSVMC